MTVNELIEKLKEHPSGIRVVVDDSWDDSYMGCTENLDLKQICVREIENESGRFMHTGVTYERMHLADLEREYGPLGAIETVLLIQEDPKP